ncbi:PstS family phosphate ABC transporter substrate-binding protein [Brucellaceae bacterium D45D]
MSTYSSTEISCADPAVADPITIVGDRNMRPLMEKLCALFQQTRPDVVFRFDMSGASTAFSALASDAGHIACMARVPFATEQASFKSAKGYAAYCTRIGYAGHGPSPDCAMPSAIYAHESNPLTGLAMADIARIFSSGSPEGDVNFWHQLGIGGDWADRRIHIYGLRDDGRYTTTFRETHLAGRAYAASYETLPNPSSVLNAVAQDPYGIGIAGPVDTTQISASVRILPLSHIKGGMFYGPDKNCVASGLYPLSSKLSLFIDSYLDDLSLKTLRLFFEIALSKKGQEIITDFGFKTIGALPLSRADLYIQRSNLKAL